MPDLTPLVERQRRSRRLFTALVALFLCLLLAWPFLLVEAAQRWASWRIVLCVGILAGAGFMLTLLDRLVQRVERAKTEVDEVEHQLAEKRLALQSSPPGRLAAQGLSLAEPDASGAIALSDGGELTGSGPPLPKLRGSSGP
jgi:hypothetical protein